MISKYMMTTIIFCFALLLYPLLNIEAQEETRRLPTTEAVDLEKQIVTLPTDLRAEWNLVSFSYDRKHGKEMEKWSDYLEQKTGPGTEFEDVPFYGILLLDDIPKWIRNLISNGMRSGIPEEDYWRILFIFQEREPIETAYNLIEGEPLQLLIVGRDGTTYTLSDQPFSDEAVAQFESNLARYADLLK